MKYLLTLLVVLAFAASAYAACITPDQQIDRVNDTDLVPDPVCQVSSYSVGTCTYMDWSFDLIRTSKATGQTIVHGKIYGQGIDEAVDSSVETTQGAVSKGANNVSISGASHQLCIEIDATYNTTGHWTDMDLQAFNYDNSN